MDPPNEYIKSDINMEQEKRHIMATVGALYKALSKSDNMQEGIMIASDLEWWFHGPQGCHYMMKMLTGKESCDSKPYKFEPRSIDAIRTECVIVEGWEGPEVYWVHVWTLKDGLITQFREYFNTWLLVKDVKPHRQGSFISTAKRSKSSILWQRHPRDLAKRSLPGIMLAI